jgi:sterol desaturase/sphingolipid hydroxylase (fatty acid hydroxylase superfamily)
MTTALQRAFYRPVVEKLERRKSTILVDILLLDYALWIWHWLNHRVAFLWRFHRVHHVDRDLDTATGLRFHFGELALSVPFRIVQVLAVRPDPLALTIWERMLMISIVFHHSNTRLPLALERQLARVFVTPRMHGIHHSDVLDETNSNWASLFTIWDQLHGTFRLDVPQEAITIGVPKYENARDVTLPRILEMPLWTTEGDFSGRESRQ